RGSLIVANRVEGDSPLLQIVDDRTNCGALLALRHLRDRLPSLSSLLAVARQSAPETVAEQRHRPLAGEPRQPVDRRGGERDGSRVPHAGRVIADDVERIRWSRRLDVGRANAPATV